MWKPAKDLGLEIERLQAGVRERTAQLEAEIENRKGWQNRAADAEAKICHSETPCEGESPDPPINLRECVQELTEALRTYAQHQPGCSRKTETPDDDCDCGLMAILVRIKGDQT